MKQLLTAVSRAMARDVGGMKLRPSARARARARLLALAR